MEGRKTTACEAASTILVFFPLGIVHGFFVRGGPVVDRDVYYWTAEPLVGGEDPRSCRKHEDCRDNHDSKI